MKTIRNILLGGALLLGMSTADARAQGLFFGLMSQQTPTIYGGRHVKDMTEQQARVMFHAMDADKDGFVSKDEFQGAYSDYFPDDPRGKLVNKRYQAIDRTGSGKASEIEFIAYRNATIDDRYTMALNSNALQDDDDSGE